MSALAELKTELEAGMTTMTEISTTQVYQVFIKATPEQIWEAITNPDFTEKYFYGSRVKSSFEVGAPYGGWSGDESQQLVDESIRPSA